MASELSTATEKRKRPLTAWELGSLLMPMHQYRRPRRTQGKERSHFLPILAFIYRNRYVLANQVQQRFSNILKSDRTARRHLGEMESLGYLNTVVTQSVGPLWPKVYHVTMRGAARLRKALVSKGKPGHIIRLDRSRTAGYSADHVVHEIWTTQFLLDVWQSVQTSDGLEILKMERRSVAANAAFRVSVHGRMIRLIPDAMFLYRQAGKGMMCCFVEIDTGTMSLKQIAAKFERYDAFVMSSAGKGYLTELYRQHGAAEPKVAFRLATVVSDRSSRQGERRRLSRLMRLASRYRVGARAWFVTSTTLAERALDLATSGRIRGLRNCPTASCEGSEVACVNADLF